MDIRVKTTVHVKTPTLKYSMLKLRFIISYIVSLYLVTRSKYALKACAGTYLLKYTFVTYSGLFKNRKIKYTIFDMLFFILTNDRSDINLEKPQTTTTTTEVASTWRCFTGNVDRLKWITILEKSQNRCVHRTRKPRGGGAVLSVVRFYRERVYWCVVIRKNNKTRQLRRISNKAWGCSDTVSRIRLKPNKHRVILPAWAYVNEFCTQSRPRHV